METIKNKNSTKYRAKFYLNGKAVTKVFDRKADADKWKRAKLIEREQIENFGMPTIQDISLSEFSKIWLINKSDLSTRSLDSYKSALNSYLVPLFGNISIKTIRIHHGQFLISKLKEKNLSVSRINFMIVFFKQLLNDAIKWEYLLAHPLRNLKKLKTMPQSERYWLPHEVLAFLNATQSDQHYALYVTALNTGMRRGELLGLQWDKVDFLNRQIEVSRIRDRYGIKNTTKSGKIVFVPMNDIVIKILLSLKREGRALDFVFVNEDGSQIDLEHVSNRIFKKAIATAQVKSIKFHNLRSTFAANFCMNGGDVYTLSKILNHSTVEMTSQKYAHLHPNYLLKAIQNIAFEASSPDLAHERLRVVQSN